MRGLGAHRLVHRRKRAHVELHRGVRWQGSIREAGADPVVAHDPMGLGQVLEERARPRVIPLLLEVGDPAAAEEEQRPLSEDGVRDPSAVELAKADVLVHGPHSYWPERAMSRRWPAAGKRIGPSRRSC